MKWIFRTYKCPEGVSLAPSLCHPLYAAARGKYILARYGGEISEEKHTSSNHLDLGGMLMVDSPSVTLRLGRDRLISCWQHQIPYVLEMLRGSKGFDHAGRKYHRVSRFPGVLVFISDKDCRRFCKFLGENQNDHLAACHKKEMIGVLEEANEHIRRKG